MKLVMNLLSSLGVAGALMVPATASATSVDLSTGTATWVVRYPPTEYPPSSTRVVAPPNAAWHATIPGAEWINISGNGYSNDPGGLYVYYTQFNGYNGEVVSGSFASDNDSNIQIYDATKGRYATGVLASNMYGTNPSNYSFDTVTDFSAVLHNSDVYYLVAMVTNGNGANDTSGPTGLLLGATATTPEPSGIALLGTGLVGAAGFMRRRLRA